MDAPAREPRPGERHPSPPLALLAGVFVALMLGSLIRVGD